MRVAPAEKSSSLHFTIHVTNGHQTIHMKTLILTILRKTAAFRISARGVELGSNVIRNGTPYVSARKMAESFWATE